MSTIPAFEKYTFDVALLPEGEGEGCIITFPDLPGCIADGATEEEAIAQARGAFHAWMTLMVEDGKPIRLPHSAAGNETDSPDALTLERLWTGKMCTISAGKVSVLHPTEDADGSASYRNACFSF